MRGSSSRSIAPLIKKVTVRKGTSRRKYATDTVDQRSFSISSKTYGVIICLTLLIFCLFLIQHQLLHLNSSDQNNGRKIDSLIRVGRNEQSSLPGSGATIDTNYDKAGKTNKLGEGLEHPTTPQGKQKVKEQKVEKDKNSDKEKKIGRNNNNNNNNNNNKDNKNRKKNRSSNGKGQGEGKKKKGEKVPKDVYNHEPEWGFHGEEKYIQVVPNLKIHIKWDRRVLFPDNMTIDANLYSSNSEYSSVSSTLVAQEDTRGRRGDDSEPPSGVVNSPRELSRANIILDSHPLKQLQLRLGEERYSTMDLAGVMVHLQQSSMCAHTPLFLTMATAGSDLYWQLVENFVFTSVKFGVSRCSLVICVSDLQCIQRCKDSFFPCFNYQEPVPTGHSRPSVMEQIAILKLEHIPKALKHGVDVFMLDLDVGFVRDPHWMLQVFHETPIVDVFVQEDYIFIMNRTKAGWKTWFTEPLPNIGMFLCRGNNRTTRMFSVALDGYRKLKSAEEKAKPGIDQIQVLNAMRVGRGTFGLKYAFFDNYTTPLLDKVVKGLGTVAELGGKVLENVRNESRSLSMHATCYEKSTKVMGLKAANAFWGPRYYDHLRPTLTKPLLFIDEKQVQEEVRALAWLAISSDRGLIIPNLLGSEDVTTVDPYKGQRMWPGFRVALVENQLKVDILEPAFYWRVHRDYDPAPAVKILYFAGDTWTNDLLQLKGKINNAHAEDSRLVLHYKERGRPNEELEEDIARWSNDSVGVFRRPYAQILPAYKQMPSLKTLSKGSAFSRDLARQVTDLMRTCRFLFGPHKGNGTCFQVCE